MSYLLFVRHPTTKRLIVVLDEAESIAEYPTEQAAHRVATDSLMCQAWNYIVVEVEL